MTKDWGAGKKRASLATISGLIVIMWPADAAKSWEQQREGVCVGERERKRERERSDCWWVRGGWFWCNPPFFQLPTWLLLEVKDGGSCLTSGLQEHLRCVDEYSHSSLCERAAMLPTAVAYLSDKRDTTSSCGCSWCGRVPCFISHSVLTYGSKLEEQEGRRQSLMRS